MSRSYVAVFAELILTPFRHVGLVWGIVPLYFTGITVVGSKRP